MVTVSSGAGVKTIAVGVMSVIYPTATRSHRA
jgi:hypothetical protein